VTGNRLYQLCVACFPIWIRNGQTWYGSEFDVFCTKSSGKEW